MDSVRSTASATRSTSSGRVWSIPGLCRMHRRNKPALAGEASRWASEPAPADSPNTVTFVGSPPNAAMLSSYRGKCGQLVAEPAVGVPGPRSVPAEPAEPPEPEHPEPVVDLDDDHALVGGQAGPVVGLDCGAPGEKGASRHPHEDGMPTLLVRGPDVKGQAALADRRDLVPRDRPAERAGRGLMEAGPNSVASRTPPQGSGAWGARKRRGPHRVSGVRDAVEGPHGPLRAACPGGQSSEPRVVTSMVGVMEPRSSSVESGAARRGALPRGLDLSRARPIPVSAIRSRGQAISVLR